MLKRVGIARARGLIAVVGTDAENVYAVLTARVLRPDLFIVTRAESDESTQKLRRAGADRVMSPYQIGGMQIAQTAVRPAVVDFVELATSADNLELAMEQIADRRGVRVRRTARFVDANLRQRYGVIVVGIQRQDRRMEFNPEPDTRIEVGDKLVVLGRPDSLKRLENAAAAGDADGRACARRRGGCARDSQRSGPGCRVVHRPGRPAARASASCWSATTRRRTSTFAAN